MPLRVGLRSSVLREVRLFAAGPAPAAAARRAAPATRATGRVPR